MMNVSAFKELILICVFCMCLYVFRGGCGQEVERSSSNWKIGGSIPGSSSPHVDVS